MSYTKEQCVERASEQPRPGYNLMSENEARELLRAHADALEKLKVAEEENLGLAVAIDRLITEWDDETESLKAKLKAAEEALAEAWAGFINLRPDDGPIRRQMTKHATIIDAALAAIREAK